MKNFLFFFVLFFITLTVQAQSFKLRGKVTNTKLEPLAFASIQLKEEQTGVISKEDGSYELNLEVGQYNLVVSMIGYKTQVINVVLNKDYIQNIILEEEDKADLEDIIIKVKVKDRAEEIMRNVIRNKDEIMAASGAYSANLYIKAIQQDSVSRKKDRAKTDSAVFQNPNADLQGMAMTEVLLHLDYESDVRMKEQRLGVKKSGNPEGLFYLSATKGNFNFYNNLVRVPAISAIPFLSPVSYSGLLAYKFKTLKTERVNGLRVFTISVKPRQISNATVEGEITIQDSTFAILHTRFSFPSYHLPQYDFFEVDQEYAYVQNKAWMIKRQQFNYYSKAGKRVLSGQTLVVYSDFQLNKQFGKNYFGSEVSATAKTAYEKDSTFWETVRTEPLSEKEVRFIHFQDSVFRASHTTAYLDSVDRITNKITWKKLGLFGQTFFNRSKERTWVIPPVISLYEPFQFGGGRINPSFYYFKRYESKKDITLFADMSFGLRNKDINGTLRLKRMYNPFNRGYYMIELNRDFDHIYEGDAWINQIQRSSYFLNNFLAFGHGLEVANGLFVYTEADYALRRSLIGYKTNSKVDSLFGNVLTNNGNQPISFDPFNAVYTKLTVKYTPKQRFVREPREKVILGSKWPTAYATWRKGIPNFIDSKQDFDYLEFGLEQKINVGILGNLHYNIKTGSFLNMRDLKVLDYQWQRRGDPFLFMNPDDAFQALDSTFATFKRFYQGHLVHEFNGALINKIPLLKKLQLREVAGGGFLIAPERNLRYGELFGGVERVFKWPFNPLTKFKLGVYVVGSVANNFSNPVQFKVGLTTWDKRRNKWH
ncbi:MAG TPA: DUF5686 and carboxypeptidase regulatory-like domain-containing protein [Flavisolibacter sp.]|nr:DUF5686 and carboxypeptidase regulatory-like domain-containing protein [Flavisolibacter sp.]